jgi:8-oxo-dGTP pyrophosphatase MutT (NUDIX family)
VTLADRLRAALMDKPTQPLLAGDDALSTSREPAQAAVLIAVTDRPEPGVILTVRRADMRTHAGQIAFPGGRIDSGEDAIAAAIREADEELGLPPADVDPVAVLDLYMTVTGYIVTPVLAAIPADLPLAPHEREVADCFEAPLAHLIDPANHQRQSALFEGRERHYYRIPWQGRNIWGATAAMLVNLSRRLRWPHG